MGFASRFLDTPTEEFVVDDRAFLLGLDELYREAMKRHERSELLSCAQKTADLLKLAPADVPIEGYYAEDEQLTQYFRLMRALQREPISRRREVATLPEFRRLDQVAASPLYGHTEETDTLLPTGVDPLTHALRETWPKWTVPLLTALAAEIARAWDDYSLVGLAARIRDPVVLAALRESVVLYAGIVLGRALTRPVFVWKVDPELAAAATRFVKAFNGLFGEELPAPIPANASAYWNAGSNILGRCVRLGTDASRTRHYHWAICRDSHGNMVVQEFWDSTLWTTEGYRHLLRESGRGAAGGLHGGCPELPPRNVSTDPDSFGDIAL